MVNELMNECNDNDDDTVWHKTMNQHKIDVKR